MLSALLLPAVSMRLRYRAQEWAADHFRWVQYPRISDARGFASAAHLIARGETASPLIRVCLALLAIFWIIVLSVAAAGGAMVAWAFIRAVIG